MSQESLPESPKKPRSTRRWRIIVPAIGAVAFLLLLAGAGVLRAYFDDARLRGILVRTLHDKLSADVTVGALRSSLWHGAELDDLVIGPLPGFTLPTLSLERVVCRWSLADLLGLRGLVISELSLRGVRMALEENAHGRNLDAVGRALGGAKKPEEPFELPHTPIRVTLQHFVVAVEAVVVQRPAQRGMLTVAGAEGSGAMQGDALDANMWLGLGAPTPDGPAAKWHLEATMSNGKTAIADIEQRLGIRLVTHGFGDMHASVDWDAEVRLQEGKALPPLHAHGVMKLDADALAGKVSVPQCDWHMGEATRLSAALHLEHLLDAPVVAVDALEATVDLDRLAPMVLTLVPGMHVGGHASLRAQPFSTNASNIQQIDTLDTALQVTASNVDAAWSDQSVHGLDANVTLSLRSGIADVRARAQMHSCAGFNHVIDGLGVDVQTVAPLAPLTSAAGAGDTQTHVEAHFARSSAPYGHVDQGRVTVDANVPVALLRGLPESSPAEGRLHTTLERVVAAAGKANAVRADVRATAWDLAARRADVSVGAHVDRAQTTVGAHALSIPSVELAASIARRDDVYRISAFDVWAARRAMHLGLHGEIDAATPSTPAFHSLEVRLDSFELRQALGLVDGDNLAHSKLAGRCAMHFDLDGKVAVEALRERSVAPALPHDPGDATWPGAMKAYTAWLQGWVNRFEAGMPFTARLGIDLLGGAYDDGATAMQGLELHATAGLRPHGPYLDAALALALARLGTAVRGVDSTLHAGFDEGVARFDWRSRAASVDLGPTASAIEGAFCNIKTSYRLGGDLAVDEVALGAENRGISFTADGVFARPLGVAATRSWLRAGLPGIDGALRWQLSVHDAKEQVLTKDGLSVSGDFDTPGSAQLADGLLTIDGVVHTKNLGVASGINRLSGLTGELPYNVKLFFGSRDDATVVARDLPVGGGVVSLVTAADDIRDRPARPVYYDRMRPYRPGVGLTAAKLQSGPYEIYDFALEGRVVDGMVLADWIAMNILGGDVVGNVALQLGRDSTVRGDLGFQASNIDASYFPQLSLKPGVDSEMSADWRLIFLLGDARRDLTVNVNFTKIGAKALDRFIQLLDPLGKDAKLQQTRDNLRWVRIRELAMWVRYENFNMDITYDPIVRIPGTQIGYRPIPRELLRRYAIGDALDLNLQPAINKLLAPVLGWTHGQ